MERHWLPVDVNSWERSASGVNIKYECLNCGWFTWQKNGTPDPYKLVTEFGILTTCEEVLIYSIMGS